MFWPSDKCVEPNREIRKSFEECISGSILRHTSQTHLQMRASPSEWWELCSRSHSFRLLAAACPQGEFILKDVVLMGFKWLQWTNQVLTPLEVKLVPVIYDFILVTVGLAYMFMHSYIKETTIKHTWTETHTASVAMTADERLAWLKSE